MTFTPGSDEGRTDTFEAQTAEPDRDIDKKVEEEFEQAQSSVKTIGEGLYNFGKGVLFLTTGALHFSYSGSLTDEETGCLKIDDDREGRTKWPDEVQEFEKEYFSGMGTLALLSIAGILHILAAIGLGVYTYFVYRYRDEVLSRDIQKLMDQRAIALTGTNGRKLRKDWSGAMAPVYRDGVTQLVFT